jgi:signal transduction histidine kinase
MHRLLLRQLRRHLGDPDSIPEEWKAFVNKVSDTYENADKDRLLAERSLEITSQELIQRLEDRKKTEEELRSAKDAAEAANRAKSEFLSNMSHELRSPLNAVVGFSDIILMRHPEGEITRLAEKIKDSGEYLTRLIEDLLDFDRIEARKVRLDLASVVINDLVESFVNHRRSDLPGSFGLEWELDPACGEIMCDTTRINQVLTNLFDNAVKYSPDGGSIRVRTRAQPAEVWISVEDEGIGLNPDEQMRIFERFQQLESGYTRRSGGLGIGLSLVRVLLELHGGDIWVESEKGKGSTFVFALPGAKGANSDLQSPGTCEARRNAAQEPWANKNILVADDIEHYHEYMRLLMSSATNVHSAYNGIEAIETAKNERPDIILMDLRMPVLDGFDAIDRLKNDPATEGIPIVAVTAQAIKEDKAMSFEAGADGFVTKPIDLEVFRKEVFKVLA